MECLEKKKKKNYLYEYQLSIKFSATVLNKMQYNMKYVQYNNKIRCLLLGEKKKLALNCQRPFESSATEC